MKKSVLLVLLALNTLVVNAQNYKLHTVFIYSFSRYVIWPDNYNHGDFEITVLGDSPIMSALEEMAKTKKVGERNIKVNQISSPTEIKKCNILFVPTGKSSELQEVMSRTVNQSILVITEEPGLGNKSGINFIMKGGKLVFELNQTMVSRQNLKIANELSRLAILI